MLFQYNLLIRLGFLLIFTTPLINCESKFEITMRRVDCSDIDTNHILNVTCHVRAVRGKKGVLDLYWIFKDVKDASVNDLGQNIHT